LIYKWKKGSQRMGHQKKMCNQSAYAEVQACLRKKACQLVAPLACMQKRRKHRLGHGTSEPLQDWGMARLNHCKIGAWHA